MKLENNIKINKIKIEFLCYINAYLDNKNNDEEENKKQNEENKG